MKLVAVLAASLLSVAAFAQSATVDTEASSAGLLGKRYVEAGFSWTDINHSSVEAMGTGLDVNVPVNANFDVSLGYGYAWLEGSEGLGHSANAAVTGYITRDENKPFARLNVGYDWAKYDSDHGFWGAQVGIERAVNTKVSSTFSVGYGDDFGQHRVGAWDVALGGPYDITTKIVLSAEVAYIEGGSIGYSAGVAYRF